MREQQNLPTVRPGHIITPQATCPIPIGSAGLWVDAVAPALKFRLASGVDAVVVSLAGLINTKVFATETARDAVVASEGDIAIVGDAEQHFSNGAWRNADGSTT